MRVEPTKKEAMRVEPTKKEAPNDSSENTGTYKGRIQSTGKEHLHYLKCFSD
jgi:hypothetical protein